MKYAPRRGFFDISERPKTLSKKEHEKMQEVQMELMHMQDNAEYFRRYHPHQWEKAKDLSGWLQGMIFAHYQNILEGDDHGQDRGDSGSVGEGNAGAVEVG